MATPEGEVTLKNDFVFALIGYRPDLDFLNSTASRSSPPLRSPAPIRQTLESERAGIYLAGVIVAGMHTNEIFIENGRFHGRAIAGIDCRSNCLKIRHGNPAGSPLHQGHNVLRYIRYPPLKLSACTSNLTSMKGARMLQSIFGSIFGCSHQRVELPSDPAHRIARHLHCVFRVR